VHTVKRLVSGGTGANASVQSADPVAGLRCPAIAGGEGAGSHVQHLPPTISSFDFAHRAQLDGHSSSTPAERFTIALQGSRHQRAQAALGAGSPLVRTRGILLERGLVSVAEPGAAEFMYHIAIH